VAELTLKEIEHLNRLTKRRDWLLARIAHEEALSGRDLTYDRAEASALIWAIEKIREMHKP
jgi:hypothetical protein